MRLTRANVQPFVGGQIKIRDAQSVFCGEIKTITVTGNGDDVKLEVVLNWRAVGQGPAQHPHRWVNDVTELRFELPLSPFHMTRLTRGRMVLGRKEPERLVYLYPPSAPTLDPGHVAGLR